MASNECVDLSFNVKMCIGLIVFWQVVITGFCEDLTDFSSHPTTVKAKENNTVLLPCHLNTLSNDEAHAKSVRWYKDEDLIADSANESLTPPDRHLLWENGSLEILFVQPDETGEYTCEILRSEPWGPVKQKHAIEVLHSPSVEPFPPTGFLQVRLGEEVRMSCKGEGIPYPIITWSSKVSVLPFKFYHLISLRFIKIHSEAHIYICINISNNINCPHVLVLYFQVFSHHLYLSVVAWPSPPSTSHQL
uniref:Hemicentin-1-like n=1 Tax=Diabrotica virgifera virgifera TaxID=50390 RepID=A0A6P7FID7_DIAVI